MEKTDGLPQTLTEAIRYFSNHETCQDFLVAIRWPTGVICPQCGAANPLYLATQRRWKCRTKHPRQQFSVKVGTIFEDSPLGLDKWLPAVWMIVNCKNGVSSYEVSRALGVTQKTAWFMLHRIREAMRAGSLDKLSGQVEADETFIGPHPHNMHKHRRNERAQVLGRSEQGRGYGVKLTKAIVAGVLDRKRGRVRAQVVGNVQASSLMPLIEAHVEPGSEMITDGHVAYQQVRGTYLHSVIDKTLAYVKGHVHTNGMENFWSLLKRGLNGTYVSVDAFHLGRYVDEQVFRYNERRDKRGDGGRFVTALAQIIGRRLTYKDLLSTGFLPATTPA